MIRVAVFLLIALLCAPYAYVHAQGSPHAIIRLHILAHNDSAAERAAKLAVRDVVLAEVSKLLAGAGDESEARRLITENASRLREVASEKLRSLHSPHAASLLWGSFLFPARTYRQLVLPAGVYQALYVNIGSGQGQNWWCIMYPPLCYVPVRRGGEVRHQFALLNFLRAFWRRVVVN